MEAFGDYILFDISGEQAVRVAGGECRLEIVDDSLTVMPRFEEPVLVALDEVSAVTAGDYRFWLRLGKNEELEIGKLGYKYDDILRVLFRMRNQLLLRNLLMNDSLKVSGIRAVVKIQAPPKEPRVYTDCELRLYETALVLLPPDGELLRLPYSEITAVEPQNYSLSLTGERGERLTLSKIGKQFDYLVTQLSETLNELSLRVQSMLRELLPQANSQTVRRASRYLKDGKAARREDLQAVAPQIWEALEQRLKTYEIGEEYAYLKSLAPPEKLSIGIKRGLMGELTGEYIWFLIPVYSLDQDRPGNFAALEAAGAEGGGGATYLFRLTDDKSYTAATSLDELHAIAERFITDCSRCLAAINFRREPIYLPPERLQEPEYRHYRTAVASIPELRELRRRFLGRVIHRSLAQWRNDLQTLTAGGS